MRLLLKLALLLAPVVSVAQYTCISWDPPCSQYYLGYPLDTGWVECRSRCYCSQGAPFVQRVAYAYSDGIQCQYNFELGASGNVNWAAGYAFAASWTRVYCGNGNFYEEMWCDGYIDRVGGWYLPC